MKISSIVRLLPVLFILALIPLNSCDVLKQAQQVANLTKCDFRLQSVNQLTLSGVNVQNIHKLSDLSLLDASKLTIAAASGHFPLEFTLNVEDRNPNTASAGMTKMAWILLIDDVEMTSGTLSQAVTIPANNGIAVIPMKMQVDLKQALSGKSADAILNFGLNLAGAGNKPSRFTLKLQPTINVSGFPITYPGYLSVGTEFGGS
jgi:hypothetical protein